MVNNSFFNHFLGKKSKKESVGVEHDTKSGFVALIGAPNVGKSTLLNHMVGVHLAITSAKPQTTRNRVMGIKQTEDTQIIFLDTPGIHKPTNELNKRLVQTAWAAVNEVELVAYLVDAYKGARIGELDTQILENLPKKTPVLLVLNKIDKLSHRDALLPIIEFWKTKFDFLNIVPISAGKGDNVNHLVSVFESHMKPGPLYFDPDQVTDLPERFVVAEFVREQLFRQLRQELPYSTAVEVDSFKEDEKIVRVIATIFVERESQKGIVVGKGGAQIKKVGIAAREKAETLLGKQVHLDLSVKLRDRWSKNPRDLDRLGYKP